MAEYKTDNLEALEQEYQKKIDEKIEPKVFFDCFGSLLEQYFRSNQSKKCTSLIESYLEYCSSFYGDNTYDFLYMICLLCFLFCSIGRIDDFEFSFERARQIANKIGSPEDAIEILSDIFRKNGMDRDEEDEKIEMLLGQMESYRQKNGVCNLGYISLAEELALEYLLESSNDEAIEILEQTLDNVFCEKKTIDSSIIARLYKDLSLCYEENNDIECALEYKKLEHECIKMAIDKDSDEYKDFFLEYLYLLVAAEEFAAAIEEGNSLLIENNRKNGEADCFSSELRCSIAMAKFLSGDESDAMAIIGNNYRINTQAYGDDDILSVEAEKKLASFLFLKRDYKEAIRLFKNVKRKAKAYYDQNSEYILYVREKLAEAYIAIGDGKHGLSEAKIVARYLEDKSGEEERFLYANYLMGCALRESGDLDGALEKLDEVCDNQVNFFYDAENEYVLYTLYAIAMIYERKGYIEKARKMYSDILESALRNIDDNNQLVLDATEKLENI